jgi:hypothetical protein
MSVTSADYLKGKYNAVRAIGSKAINSDSYMEIEGHEAIGVLIKQFPWPVFGAGGAFESATPGGGAMWHAEVAKANKQGQVVIDETVGGMVQRFVNDVMKAGGFFNAVVYEGSPEKFYRAYKLKDCLFVPDDTERGWENRTQILSISGNLYYHFFGEEIPGNTLASA